MFLNPCCRLSLFLLILFVITCNAIAFASPVLSSEIENNQDQKKWVDHINIKDLPHAGKWQLAFSYAAGSSLREAKGGEIVRAKQSTDYQSTGDFYIVEFIVPENRTSASFDVIGNSAIQSYSIAPNHFFLIDSPGTEQAVILPVESSVSIPGLVNISGKEEFIKNEKKNHISIEGNPAENKAYSKQVGIVPIPVELKEGNDTFLLTNKVSVSYADPAAESAVRFFANTLKSSLDVTIETEKNNSIVKSAILFTKEGANALTAQQQAEGYLLSVTSNRIVVHAATEAGFFYGMQTLRQLLPAEFFSKKAVKNAKKWNIPTVEIKDYPRFSYRGMHLDVARHFIPAEQVKRFIDLMAMHKLNHFQWHLTDDEGWRVEIKKYPELTQVGSQRGFDLTKKDFQHNLYPAFGSGVKSYGGYYTQDQIREIVKYASDRHITIVPEIDLPGHARALIMSLPKQLIDPTDTSEYLSVQAYKDNVISPCIDSTYEVVDNIMREVADLFPGKYIHIGGDEVPAGVWMKSPSCQKLGIAANSTDDFREKIHNYFNERVQKILMTYNKSIAGWEEVANDNSMLAKPLAVYVWNAEKFDQAYNKSKKMGYDVILSTASSLYFDLSYDKDAREHGFNWAGYVGTYEPYAFLPIPADKSAEVIKGVQGQLWSETIMDPEQDVDYAAFPKLAGLSEMAWSPAVKRDWKDFSARMGRYHLPRLDFYGVKYRVSPPGVNVQNGWLMMNNEFTGTTLLYTVNGSSPKVYEGPVQVSGKVKAKAFSVTGRESRESE